MDGTAASAGYMIAVPAARIFARESTLTGSIGVLLQTGEISGLLQRVGITAEAIVSGPLKNQPSLDPPAVAAGPRGAAGPGDGHVRPVRRHGRGRPAHDAASRSASWPTAAPYTGRQALGLGLIDAIGGEPEARAWLAAEKGISAGLPVEDVEPAGLARRAFAGSVAPLLGELTKAFSLKALVLTAPGPSGSLPAAATDRRPGGVAT